VFNTLADCRAQLLASVNSDPWNRMDLWTTSPILFCVQTIITRWKFMVEI
jgi:hypothetical protein